MAWFLPPSRSSLLSGNPTYAHLILHRTPANTPYSYPAILLHGTNVLCILLMYLFLTSVKRQARRTGLFSVFFASVSPAPRTRWAQSRVESTRLRQLGCLPVVSPLLSQALQWVPNVPVLLTRLRGGGGRPLGGAFVSGEREEGQGH